MVQPIRPPLEQKHSLHPSLWGNESPSLYFCPSYSQPCHEFMRKIICLPPNKYLDITIKNVVYWLIYASYNFMSSCNDILIKYYLCTHYHGTSYSPSRGTEAGIASVNAGKRLVRLVSLTLVLTTLNNRNLKSIQ